MFQKSEKSFLNLIKYAPPLAIIIIFTIIITLLYYEKQNSLQKERDQVRFSYIKDNKIKIKKDVEQLKKYIKNTQVETEEKLKNNIKDRVYEAYNIAYTIYNKNVTTKSKQEIQKMIHDALVNIRFNDNRGYYFIYSSDSEAILLPLKEELEGEKLFTHTDSAHSCITKNIIREVKEKREKFRTWWFHKPNDLEKHYKKIGFYKYFEPYDWFIGSGEYFEDFENQIKKEVINSINKFSNDSHNFFILNYNSKILLHKNKDFIGKKISSLFQDDEEITKDIINVAKSGSGYLSYVPKNTTHSDTSFTKNIYIENIQNWNWAIGKLFDQTQIQELFKKKEQELNEKFKINFINLLTACIILIILFLIISKYFSILLENRFSSYKKDIKNFIEERTKNHHIISQQAKMAAMGEMLGNIAHQWRQPLSLISTLSTGIKLQKELNALNDETLNKSLDNITETVQYLSKTIDDFRDFYKSENNENYFEIQTVIEKAVKLTSASFRNHQIELISNTNNFKIYGLENKFLQALINILNNSKDALETVENKRFVFLDTYEKDNKKIIEIKDTAGGVKKEILDKVCEPYFTTKDFNKGTGIGLYMTNQIISKHMNGVLTIKNLKFKYDEDKYTGLLIRIEFNKD